jgi:hypothetical protein
MKIQISVPLSRLGPMPLADFLQPFDHPTWLFEMKFDNFCRWTEHQLKSEP